MWQWWWNYAVACVDSTKPDQQPLKIESCLTNWKTLQPCSVFRTFPSHILFRLLEGGTTFHHHQTSSVQLPSIAPLRREYARMWTLTRTLANNAALSHSSHNIVPKQNTKHAIVTHADECAGRIIFAAIPSPLLASCWSKCVLKINIRFYGFRRAPFRATEQMPHF